jgi:hypothetical protein
MKIEGYFSYPKMPHQAEQKFNEAKNELIRNIEEELENIKSMSFEKWADEYNKLHKHHQIETEKKP